MCVRAGGVIKRYFSQTASDMRTSHVTRQACGQVASALCPCVLEMKSMNCQKSARKCFEEQTCFCATPVKQAICLVKNEGSALYFVLQPVEERVATS
jgi:hypothetical protein